MSIIQGICMYYVRNIVCQYVGVVLSCPVIPQLLRDGVADSHFLCEKKSCHAEAHDKKGTLCFKSGGTHANHRVSKSTSAITVGAQWICGIEWQWCTGVGGGGWGFIPPKFRMPSKFVPNSTPL